MLALALLPIADAVANGDAQTRWRRAIDNDDAVTLRRLIDEPVLSTTNEKGKTALMTAAKLGDFALYRELLDRGQDPLQRSSTGGTVLMYAVLGNRLDFVEFVLKRQRRIDLQSTNGWTAAMIAAAKGYADVLDLLISAGADFNIADAYRWSPLMRAIDNRHLRSAQMLARHRGIQLDWQNENRASALHVAASVGDLPISTLLVSLGADRQLLDNNGHSARDIAIAAGHDEIARLLAD